MFAGAEKRTMLDSTVPPGEALQRGRVVNLTITSIAA